MQIDRRIIESSLIRKGFILEESDHHYFYHEYDGKRTGAYTYTSHGSGYKTYTEPLFRMMKKQLQLDRIKQVEELFMCPMDGDSYNQILRDKGLLNG